MFCRNCGKEMKDAAKFCPHCGAAIDIGNIDNKKFGQSRKKHKKSIWIGAIIFIVVFGTVVFLILGKNSGSRKTNGRIDLLCGINMDWDEFSNDIVEEKFDMTMEYDDGSRDMEIKNKGVFCNVLNDNSILMIYLADYFSEYCIGGAYVGQEMSAVQDAVAKEGFGQEEEAAVPDDDRYDSYASYRKGELRMVIYGSDGKVKFISVYLI